MKIVSWNVNGLRSIINKGFLESIKILNPDIICLQEIKSKQDQVDSQTLEILSFDHYYWNSADRAGYSGTAVFTKVLPLNINLGMGQLDKFLIDEYGDCSKEGRVITLEFENFYLVNVYTPNVKPDLSRLEFRFKKWDPLFLEYVNTLKQKKHVVICGDFNVAHEEIDLARPKENSGNAGFTNEERSGFSNLLRSGFIDSFRYFNSEGGHYTWWSYFGNARKNNVGWRIDYFVVSENLAKNMESALIHNEIFGSDHCPIEMKIKF